MGIKKHDESDGQTHLKVLRNPNRKRFTVIDNESVRDKSLSFKARGILLLLLSMDDGWHVTIERVAGLSREKVGSVASGMKELVAAGYLVRSNERDDRGRFSWKMTVIESPSKNTTPQVDFPRMDYPCTDNRVFNRNKNTPHRSNLEEITPLSISPTPQENPHARDESFQDPDSATHTHWPKPKDVSNGNPNQHEDHLTKPTIDAKTDTPEKRRPGRPRKPIPANDTQNAVEALESPPNALQMPNCNQGKPIQNEKQESDGDTDKATHHSLLSKSVALTPGAPVGETIDNLNHTEYYGSCEDDTYLPIGSNPVEIDFMDAHEQIEGLPRGNKKGTAKLINYDAKTINSEINSDPFNPDDKGTIARPNVDAKTLFQGHAKKAQALAIFDANPQWFLPAVRRSWTANFFAGCVAAILVKWSETLGAPKMPHPRDLPILQTGIPPTVLPELSDDERDYYVRWAVRNITEREQMRSFFNVSEEAKRLWVQSNSDYGKTPYPGA